MGTIGNRYSEIVKKYTDNQIIEVIEKANDHTYDLYEACRNEATLSEQKNHRFDNSLNNTEKKYLAIIHTNVSHGAKIEDCETFLLNEGIQPERIPKIIRNVDKSKINYMPIEPKEKPKIKRYSFWGFIIVIYIIFRLMFMLFR